MELDVRALRLIEAIHQEGTLTAAADRLHRTQPALSLRLKQLEERVGTSLFERKPRRMTLTPAGRRVLRAARTVLEELHHAESDIAQLAEGRAGTLRVSTECYTCYHWLPALLQDYESEFPDVTVEIEAEATQAPAEFLMERKTDVALITKGGTEDDQLSLTPLFDDEIVALVAPEHPWARRPHVGAEAFRDERLVVYQTCRRSSEIFSKVLIPAGVEPDHVTTLPTATQAAIEMVKAQRGVTTMATWAARPQLRAGTLAAVRITPGGLSRTWHAATRNETLPTYAERFVEHLAASALPLQPPVVEASSPAAGSPS